jgi:pilus assembly protein Flp/PilA
MSRLFARVATDESGATAIEYGLIAASVAIVILGAVEALGSEVTNLFVSTLDAMK